LLRVPLNVFVVTALGMTREGRGFREGVFRGCVILLGGVGAVVGGLFGVRGAV